MKMITWIAAAGVAVACLNSGCDWSSGHSADSISDRYNWVNFSGLYRGVGGGMIVTDFPTTPGTAGTTNAVTSEHVATEAAGVSAYHGVLGHNGILPNTVTIVAGVFALTDNGGGVLAGSGKTGTIDYSTGAWSIDLSGEWTAGTAILASYTYAVAGSVGATGPGSGSSGKMSLFTFNVTQSGNSLSIVDNNGRTYSGTISSIRSTGGSNRNTPGTTDTPMTGDTLIGSFTASGTSAVGMKVKIVGVLQAVVASSTAAAAGTGVSTGTTTIMLNNRVINGTWIESKGKTGNIVGEAPLITTTATVL